MMFMTAIAALLGVASQVANAAPVHETRDVWDPRILYPHAGTVWYSGQRHNVTWETSDAPKQITGANGGFILLRSGEYETPVVLAHDITLLDGRVEVTVPDVITGNFSLVLFGDSGNWGDDFLINGVITF
ncbi:hypothetical protein EW026_g7822 [Hermanssonia centrifuga]|uniref:Uncharacterized protein n=2 Tax=Hermanssonia centrifuga TaxID=98765 RepID=A0A4S4K6J6_9APHY|nr:hypothetical protein PHLCEN_2v9182 [Hermanssonia centrifuga]THG93403.1 hypothetical protein EW026_g7822 [Hermanssonia centrifuga]